MSEKDQSTKLGNVYIFSFSILLLIQHNFIISRLVVYKTEYNVKRQGMDTLTKTKKLKNS